MSRCRVRDGRLTLDTPLTMSARAARRRRRRWLRSGTEVTLDNASRC